MASVWPSRIWGSAPSGARQIFTVPSPVPEASQVPPGPKADRSTATVSASQRAKGCPVATEYRAIQGPSMSPSAMASHSPASERARASMGFPVPFLRMMRGGSFAGDPFREERGRGGPRPS